MALGRKYNLEKENDTVNDKYTKDNYKLFIERYSRTMDFDTLMYILNEFKRDSYVYVTGFCVILNDCMKVVHE